MTLLRKESSLVLITKLLGILAIISSFITISLSWILNRNWFVYTKCAFSDFGGKNSCCPHLYNYGLIITGIIIIFYSIYLWIISNDKYFTTGSGFFALAGVFLALIGFFHEGTRPHVFVSTWFFIQSDLSLIFIIYSFYRLKINLSKYILILEIIAFPIAIIIGMTMGWPSAAVLETYGIFYIYIGVLFISININKYIKLIRANSPRFQTL